MDAMNHLEKLSDVACQAQRLEETQANEKQHVPNRKRTDSSSSQSPGQSSSRNPSCDGISENDRNTIKEKIKNAFKKRSNENYDELLELCTSLTEENVYFPAPSRLDYYKNGISEVKRIFEKAEEIKTISEINKSGNELEEGQKSLKRAKTQH